LLKSVLVGIAGAELFHHQSSEWSTINYSWNCEYIIDP